MMIFATTCKCVTGYDDKYLLSEPLNYILKKKNITKKLSSNDEYYGNSKLKHNLDFNPRLN